MNIRAKNAPVSIIVMSITWFAAVCCYGGCKSKSQEKAMPKAAPKQFQEAFATPGQPTPVPNPSATVPPADAPKISFEQTEYDFGDLDQGEKVEHLFLFKNVGKGTLVINKVRSS